MYWRLKCSSNQNPEGSTDQPKVSPMVLNKGGLSAKYLADMTIASSSDDLGWSWALEHSCASHASTLLCRIMIFKDFCYYYWKNYMVSKFINRWLKVFWQYLINKQYMISQKNQTLLFCFFHDVTVFIYFSVFRKFLLLTGSVSLVLVACFRFVNHWHDINKDKLNWLYGSPIMEGLAWIPFVALCARSHLDYKAFFFFL